jgi:hypothetical protein
MHRRAGGSVRLSGQRCTAERAGMFGRLHGMQNARSSRRRCRLWMAVPSRPLGTLRGVPDQPVPRAHVGAVPASLPERCRMVGHERQPAGIPARANIPAQSGRHFLPLDRRFLPTQADIPAHSSGHSRPTRPNNLARSGGHACPIEPTFPARSTDGCQLSADACLYCLKDCSQSVQPLLGSMPRLDPVTSTGSPRWVTPKSHAAFSVLMPTQPWETLDEPWA